jgi:hypothetical protein
MGIDKMIIIREHINPNLKIPQSIYRTPVDSGHCCTGNEGEIVLKTEMNKAVYGANETVKMTIKIDASKTKINCVRVLVSLKQ